MKLEEDSVCARIAHTASDEKTYKVKFYALQAVIAVGFKIDNQRAVQFRKWIITIAKDYTIKGFVMDDERFKLSHKLTNQYFEEQLARIREIRESERMFYQKVTDIYSTAIDYDKSAKTTKDFLKKCRTNYIMPFIGTPHQKKLWREQMQNERIWD